MAGIKEKGPEYFFRLSLFYSIVLCCIAVLGLIAASDDSSAVSGWLLFFAVPWFGALGAVTISLYGVFSHNESWERHWNYWHFARPFVGMILGAVACLILFGVVRAANPAQEMTGVSFAAASTQIPYFVLAFVVGFREGTFRKLITRATDLLLGAEEDRDARPARPSATPRTAEFGSVALRSTGELVVMVSAPAVSGSSAVSEVALRIVPSDSAFAISPESTDVSVRVDGCKAVVLTYTPTSVGAAEAMLLVDLFDETVTVRLTGTATA